MSRHLKSMPNNPPYLKGRPLVGHIKDGETTIRTVCQRCHRVIIEGPPERTSHGTCDRCYRMELAKLATQLVTEYGTVIARAAGRSVESDAAFDRVSAAIYDIVDVPTENGPDGDARQRVESHRSRPTGVDDSKVAESGGEGNSGGGS